MPIPLEEILRPVLRNVVKFVMFKVSLYTICTNKTKINSNLMYIV